MNTTRRRNTRRPGGNRSKRGTVMLMALGTMFIVGSMTMFSIQAATADSRTATRALQRVQAQALAEGALERAKGDILAQFAATNFLQDPFETIEDKYLTVNQRFNTGETRIPGDTDLNPVRFSDFEDKTPAWDFTADPNLDLSGMNDWGVGPTGAPIGNVRVYVTRARLDDTGDPRRNALATYGLTVTAVATVGEGDFLEVTSSVSRNFEHQLTFPNLTNFLLLGNQLSDCSMCHLKMLGEVGQVRADDPFQFHISYEGTRFRYTRLWGSLHLNGKFIRRANSEGTSRIAQETQEQFLVNAGTENFVYASNSGQLAAIWRMQNPSADPLTNPFRTVDSDPTPLPARWPSVKENLMNWFEPRAMAKAATGDSEIRVEPRDNNIRQMTFTRWTTTGTITVGSNDPYGQAIDRTPLATSGTGQVDTAANRNRLIYDRGLHPADDLDNDGIPNGVDADIDNDGLPESKRGSSNPNDPAYQLTDASLASNLVYDSRTGRHEWQPGRVWNASANRYNRTTDYVNQVLARINDTTRSDLYREATVAGTREFYWDGQVTGIATSMANLLNNEFASTSGASAGTVRGVFPSDAKTGDGSPDYTANGGVRSLVILGSRKNPIRLEGQSVVRGDVVIAGVAEGRGSIVTHRNVYIPTNLEYKTPPNWADTLDDSGDQLGILAGGNIIVGNLIHNTSGRSDIMEFVWGNMVSVNDKVMGTAGSDAANDTRSHMVNPAYLMDGQDGGRWVGGVWRTENAGNTVANVNTNISVTAGPNPGTSTDPRYTITETMRISGGLDTTSPYFNPNRKHLNFDWTSPSLKNYTDSNNNGVRDSNEPLSTSSPAARSLFKNYYISTPGLLPAGSNPITEMPTTAFGVFSGGWFNSNDMKFLTQFPLDSSGNPVRGLGAENQNKWVRDVEGVLYTDNAVVGGSISNGARGTFLEFKGTVIGKDIQILSVQQRSTRENSTNQNFDANWQPYGMTNDVGALYYDWRLRRQVNPLEFPMVDQFWGGESTLTGLPPKVSGNRDNWVPFNLTDEWAAMRARQ
jgi:hypothetical protein